MAQDAEVKMQDRKSELLDAELEKFKDAYFKSGGGSHSALTW